MEKSKHFTIDELLPPHVATYWGERGWMFLDPRLLVIIDELREYINRPVIVNSKAYGRQWSGFRTPEYKKYSPMSQHSHGRAIDGVGDWSPEEIRQDILVGKINFTYSVTIETHDVTPDHDWLHIDVRNNTGFINEFKVN